VLDSDGLNEFGKGYTYDYREYFEASDLLLSKKEGFEDYKKLKIKYTSKQDIMQCFTDLGFAMASKVWNSTDSKNKGNFYFCVGGVNDINPFHKNALKNEIFVYRSIVNEMTSLEKCTEMTVFDINRNPTNLDTILSSNDSVFIDFNGSMAFFSSVWRIKLISIKQKIKSVFVMGGVLSDKTAVTKSSIKNVLNRMSCSTMNQLYAPLKSNIFISLMSSWKIPIYMTVNNTVDDLFNDNNLKIFLTSNGIFSSCLYDMAILFYNSHYKPFRKPFDFYTALSLVSSMNGDMFGKSCNLCIDSVYGITLVTHQIYPENTTKEYTSTWDTHIGDEEKGFLANAKKNYACEQIVLSFAACDMIYEVLNVDFKLKKDNFFLEVIKNGQEAVPTDDQGGL